MSLLDEMLMHTSEVLANASPCANTGNGPLLPAITEIANLSKAIAFGITKIAQKQGVALEIPDELLKKKIDKNFWVPRYRKYKRVCD